MRRTSVKALAILGCCGFALAAAGPREAAAQPATSRTACADPGALGVSRTIALDTAGGLHVGLKTYPQTLALADKEVVLTFDDGPLPGPTDRTLDALHPRPLSIGVGFELNRVETIRPEPHDRRLDAIVTEAGIMHFG